MNNSEKYVLVKGSAGLGNRMLAATTGILYAQLSGRKLIIDWSDQNYSSNGINVFHHYFDSPLVLGLEYLPLTDSIYPLIWKTNMTKSFDELRKQIKAKDYREISFDISKLDYEEDILVFSAYGHKTKLIRSQLNAKFPHLCSQKNSQILKDILKDHFRLKNPIRNKINQFKEKYFVDKNIGVHIRYTDMKISKKEIYSKVKKLKQKYMKNTQIFLATDSQEIVDEFCSLFDNVVTLDKWFSFSGQRLHSNSEDCRDRIDNGVEALMDLYLLSECNSLVFSSQSSFGLVASLLMNQPQQNIYDINQMPVNLRLIKRVENWVGNLRNSLV